MDLLSPIKTLFEFAFPFLDQLPVIRVLMGIILVYFLPGFVWTLVLFKEIKNIERTVLSFGLSIAFVTLSLFFLNKVFNVRITGFNAILVIVFVTIIPAAIYYLNRFIRQRKEHTE